MVVPRAAAIGLLTALLVGPAHAIDEQVHDDLRFALQGAAALCGNLSLAPSYSEKARLWLGRAGNTLALAAQHAKLGNYLPALTRAKKGISRADAAVRADPALRIGVYGTLANVTEASRALVRAAIDEVARGHAAEAGRASLPYARALAEQEAQHFDDALALLRKAFKKLARVLGT